MSEPWPPPVRDEREWIQAPQVPSGRLREVRLWGAQVLIDDEGLVFCDGCNQVVAPAELLRRSAGHRPLAGVLPASSYAMFSLDDGPSPPRQ